MTAIETKGPKKLLIIGNGFDLACGLPSKISDYISQIDNQNHLERAFEQIQNNWDTYPKTEGGLHLYPTFRSPLREPHTDNVKVIIKNVEGRDRLSFWDLLFKLERNEHKEWNEVEGEIGKVVIYTQKNPMDQLLESRLENHPDEMSLKLMKVFGVLAILRNLNADAPISSEFLKDELSKFENNFANYLIQVIGQKLMPYRRSAELLTQKLVQNNPYNVLSFNYTFPFLLYRKRAIPKKYKNVHGTLKESAFMGPIDENNYPSYNSNNIIFGIDASNISDTRSPEAYTFTKTFRSLANTSSPTRDLLFDNINEIVFYGHSLSHADYSYFLSIFDHYNIYDNTKISLTFCYNPQLSQYDQFEMVTHLLNAYGRSLTNNNHGDNLLHKLILEGRLSIKPIEFNKVD